MFARMMESVDMRDLKSLGLNSRAGSSPALRTKKLVLFRTYFSLQHLL